MAGKNWTEKELPALVRRIVATCRDGKAVNLIEGHNLPDRHRVTSVLERLFDVLFPGLSTPRPVTKANLHYFIGEHTTQIYMELTELVERAFRYGCKQDNCDHCDCATMAHTCVTAFLEAIPAIRKILKQDIQSAFEGDPAAQSQDAIILCYPGIEAIATYRLAHELYTRKVPLIPRMWTEHAHSRTGIDINPGAQIGPGFFIDHGTGVVIGETCEIGRNVAVYQGVTLGALAPAKGQKLRGKKRHPTIEDNVIIYAGATILGGETVIGTGAVVGGNVWLTQSVAPHTTVIMEKTDLVFLDQKKKRM